MAEHTPCKRKFNLFIFGRFKSCHLNSNLGGVVDTDEKSLFHTHKDLIIEILTVKLKKHHELYRFPCKAELFEDLFAQTLEEVTPDRAVLWGAGSHTSGADVTWGAVRIQNKSGDFNLKKGTVKFSGSRTTKYKKLEEKIDFLSEDKYDLYVFLGREKEFNNDSPKYIFMWFDARKLDYRNLTWEEKEKYWEGQGENFSCKIVRSMSDQVWLESKISYLGEVNEIQL